MPRSSESLRHLFKPLPCVPASVSASAIQHSSSLCLLPPLTPRFLPACSHSHHHSPPINPGLRLLRSVLQLASCCVPILLLASRERGSIPSMAPDREEMETPCAGYRYGPPWVFKGSALYQLHLVKASTARAFVPRDLRLVEAFGYTLGGMFLARYHDSPAGAFDELVVIAGIVWNPPTSCAWAARVLVNSVEACRHGRKEVGLPSHVATFSKTEGSALGNKPLVRSNGLLSVLGIGSTVPKQERRREIEVCETKGSSAKHLCNISMPLTGSHRHHKWMGPAIRMSLPSFSGQTEDHPDLLKYSCQVECRVRPVKPARIWNPKTTELHECSDGKIDSVGSNVLADSDAQSQSISVLLSKPIFALEFSSLRMHVDAPKIVVPHCKKKEVGFSST